MPEPKVKKPGRWSHLLLAAPAPSSDKASPPTQQTLLDKVIVAIREYKDPGGSSRGAIAKYLKAEYGVDVGGAGAAAFKKALKKGVDSGKLTQNKQSFLIAGEAYEVPETEQLQMTDTKEGTGAEAEHGCEVRVKYVGKLDDGSVFDKAPKFEFLLGAGEVIKGWDQGVLGMKEGGKRSLVVPSNLGYGKRGSAPEIPPNATLHFDIVLSKVL